MIVGGEFFYDSKLRVEQPIISTRGMNFLNGGKACLIVISEYLLSHGIDRVLLPAYLCPTIVNTLERCGLGCDYYRVRPDFSIDLEDLVEKAIHHHAVYFINYFGFFHSSETRDFLENLRTRGMLLIEDNAQAGFVEEPIGDFVFNSLRKLCPYDGGYLLTPFDVTIYIEKYRGTPNQRLPVIREYRSRLADYLFHGKGDHEELVRLYQLAEKYNDTDLVVAGDEQEQLEIEHLDWEGIRSARRRNYEYLASLIAEIPVVSPAFSVLPAEVMPMGLPIYVPREVRDRLFDALGEAGIGLTIHWDAILGDSRLNGDAQAVDMASCILTLVIDQRTSHKQMDYMAHNIKIAFAGLGDRAGEGVSQQ